MGLKRRGGNEGGSGGDGKNIVYVNLEEGVEYEARLVYVADLGLHKNDYKGELKPDVQKIALGFEFMGETVEIDEVVTPKMLWDNPFNIYHTLTEKGTELVKFKIFDKTAEDGDIADWDSVLGTPVTITVKHVKDKKDPTKFYDNINSIEPIPKKFQKGIAKAELTVAVGDSEDKDNEATKALYGLTQWMYDRRVVEGGRVDPVSGLEGDIRQDDEDIPF